MHITNLLQDGTRVATAFTTMPLIGGNGKWVVTAEGAFHVHRVYNVVKDKWTGHHNGFAEVEPMKKAGPPITPQTEAKSFFGTEQERDAYWRAAWNS